MRTRRHRIPILMLSIAGVIAAACLVLTLLAPRIVPFLEARLAHETGLAWRIGGIGPDFAGGLVLEDVTVRGPGLAGEARRIGLSGFAAPLLGSDGTLRVSVAGISLKLPLDPGAAGPLRGTASLAAVRAVIHEISARLAEDGRTVTLGAGAVDLALDIRTAPTARDPAIRVDLTDAGIVAEIAAAAPDAARDIAVTRAGQPALSVSARLQRDAAGLRLDRIAGTLGTGRIAGSLAVVEGTRGRPLVRADLSLDALTLVEPGGEPDRSRGGGIAVPVRQDILPEPGWFTGFEAEANLTVARLVAGPIETGAVALSGRVTEGRLDLALDAATLYGGSARGRYVLEPDRGTGRHRLSLSLDDVRTGPLLRAVAGVSGLDGGGRARLDVQGWGKTADALLRSLGGEADILVRDGRIDGLGLARSAGLADLGSTLATRLDTLGATFTMDQGRAATDTLRLRTGLIDAEGRGQLDLAARTIEMTLTPQRGRARGALDVTIRVSGPWSSPSVSADLSGLARDPAGALQDLQDLGERFLNGSDARPGQGLGGLLDGLVPRSTRPPKRAP